MTSARQDAGFPGLSVPSRIRTTTPALVTAAATSVVVAAVLNATAFAAEPVFAAVNVATTTTLVTFGLQLVLSDRGTFTGWCFAVAGVSWLLAVVDRQLPDTGPLLQWTASGVTYTALAWGVLRYRRTTLEIRGERWFITGSLVLTVGIAAVTAPLIPPETLGYPAAAFWPRLADSSDVTAAALGLNCTAFATLAIWFCVLMARMLRVAPFVSRRFLRPVAISGGVLAVGSALVQIAAMIAPTIVTLHFAVAAVGSLILVLSAALALTILLRQTTGSRLVDRLPPVRTAETVADYVRAVLGDPTAELWYWSADSAELIDEHGLPHVGTWPPAAERFSVWINGSAGARVALLVTDAKLDRDPASLETLGRVLSIVAENARLGVLLRLRVAELNATRIAEQMAFEKAREQFHRNLHDGLQQTIASVRMDLDGLYDVLPDGVGHDVVAALDSRLVLALDQVHSLKRGTDPPELRFGLKPAIERSIAEMRMDASCQITSVNLGVLTLPVYYLVREAMTNVYKHARAGRIDIAVTTDRRSIDVRVSDDGVGGAVEAGPGGITGMRRRAEELGGRFEVTSVADEGTIVAATLPFIAS